MERLRMHVLRLNLIVKRLEIAGSTVSKQNYETKHVELLTVSNSLFMGIACHLNLMKSDYIDKSSVSGKLEAVFTNVNSVTDMINSFRTSSGKKHYTNFNYVRNYAIFKFKETISILKSLQSDLKSVFETDCGELMFDEQSNLQHLYFLL